MFNKPSVILNIILPLILGTLLLYGYSSFRRSASEIGLGKGTSFYTAVHNSEPIHITSLEMADSLFKGWKKRGQKELSLWFGNSQLNGINQFVEGQKNCTAFAFETLLPYKKELLGVSFPNGNLQEFLVSVLFLCNKFPVKNMILPVFYDDMREDGIRNEVNSSQVTDMLTGKQFKQYVADVPSIITLKASEPAGEIKDQDMKALDQTAQEYSEIYLDSKLKSSWTIWMQRGDIRGNLFNDVYRWRNFLLGIKATTVRKMIPGKFQSNHAALLNIIKFCRDQNIHLVVYVPPIRNDVTQPYDLNGYSEFKARVEKDCRAGSADFINLEALVPAKYWGNKIATSVGEDEEIDFMHFQQPGHKLIADTISRIILNSNY